jgi:hypothetical protein
MRLRYCLRVLRESALFRIFPKGVARLAFSAQIGRARSHRARSASKKAIWLLIPFELAWLPARQKADAGRMCVFCMVAEFKKTHPKLIALHPANLRLLDLHGL